jgi:hypothetical protein
MSLFGGSKKTSGLPSSPAQQQVPLMGYQVQSSCQGATIAIVYGQQRIPGNIIWAAGFQAIPHYTTTTNSTPSGGKGGGGGGSKTTTTTEVSYTYAMDIMIGICKGPIAGVSTVYIDSTPYSPASWFSQIMLGASPASPWGYLSTRYPSKALAYSGLAVACAAGIDLGSGAQLPNFNFEVQGLKQFNPGAGIIDALPSDIIHDFLTNPNYGCGWASGLIGDLTQFANYCKANNIFLSPQLTSQEAAAQFLEYVCQLSNSEIVWSGGVLNVVPYGDTAATGNGVTFTPNMSPEYNLGPDDFISEKGNPPVTASRTAISDAYNWFQLEIFDRSNNYNTAIIDIKDMCAVDLYGPRIQTSTETHAICSASLAQFIGQTMLQKCLYIRNTYKFKLDGRYLLLDPMDWVSLTIPHLGISGAMCRVVSIEEGDDGTLSFEVEEWPEATGTPALHTMQPSGGLALDLNVAPGNVNPPTIFEAPALLTQNGYEVWLAACGGPNWGGAEVWTSFDGTTYKRLGLVINPARIGILEAQFNSGSDPDTVNSCQVDLTQSLGVLFSGTQADADLLATAFWVDGEIISYQTATLTAANKYTLGDYLRRGAYLTPITGHAANSPVVRLDQAIFKIPYDPTHIGQTVYIKLLSYNLWHGAIQSLSDVDPFTFYLSGAGMTQGLPGITNLSSFYQSNQMSLVWDKADDPLASYRFMDYEVRKGTAWGTAEIVARTDTPNCPCYGDGTYWVAAHYKGWYGVTSSITVTNSSIIGTVLASGDEYAAGWLGAMTGGVFKTGANLEISGGGSGTYTIPAGSLVDLGSCKLVTVAANYLFESVLPTPNIDDWTDFDSIPDMDGLAAGQADVKVQIRISQDGSTWGNWQDLKPGQYYAWGINLRLALTVYQAGVTPVVSEFNWQVGQ